MVLAMVGLAISLWSTSCGGGAGAAVDPPAGPAFSASSTTLTFSNQAVGATSAAQSATVTNSGNAPLTFSGGVQVMGPNAGDYKMSSTCGNSLAPSAQCTVSVAFTPSAAGSRTASVMFNDNAAGSPQSMNLAGMGTAAGVGLSVGILTFGSQLMGTSTPVQSVTVTNSGDAPLAISSLAVTGTDAGDFPETTTCGSSVPAGGSCTISVMFTPAAVGSRAATVAVADGAAGSPQTVTLTGTGANPTVSLSSTALGFGNQNLGTASSAHSVTLNNTGNASLNISDIALTGANAGDFAEATTCGAAVAAGGSCAISVVFTPSSAGSRTASVAISDNASGNLQMITLTGSGAGISAVASFSPSALTFGSQSVGASSSGLAVSLSNTGNATLTYTPPIPVAGANATDFGESDNCGGSVAAGANCTIHVTFTPSAVGTRTASLAFASNASNSPQAVSVSGTGTASTVSLFPATLAFPIQTVGTTSTSQAVLLTNTGNTSLSIASLAPGGASPGDFGQTNNCGSSVAAGAACTINVSFTPTAPGTRTAAVAITDNASGSPQTVSLTGTGGGPAVNLTTTSLSFGTQTVGTTGAAQPIALTNTGTAALTVSSIAVTGANPGDLLKPTPAATRSQQEATCTSV